MPRHIRSVTARRPRRIARFAKDGPPAAAAAASPADPSPPSPPAASSATDPAISLPAGPPPVVPRVAARPPAAAPVASPRVAAPPATAAQVALLEGLRRAFQVAAGTPEPPERIRERYIAAIESVADFLEAIGADAACVERIDELGWALEDLTNGLLPPLLQPSRPSSPR